MAFPMMAVGSLEFLWSPFPPLGWSYNPLFWKPRLWRFRQPHPKVLVGFNFNHEKNPYPDTTNHPSQMFFPKWVRFEYTNRSTARCFSIPKRQLQGRELHSRSQSARFDLDGRWTLGLFSRAGQLLSDGVYSGWWWWTLHYCKRLGQGSLFLGKWLEEILGSWDLGRHGFWCSALSFPENCTAWTATKNWLGDVLAPFEGVHWRNRKVTIHSVYFPNYPDSSWEWLAGVQDLLCELLLHHT